MKTMNEQSEYQLWWEDGVIDGVETLLSVVRKQVPEIENLFGQVTDITLARNCPVGSPAAGKRLQGY